MKNINNYSYLMMMMIWCSESSYFFWLHSSSWFIIYKSRHFRNVFCFHHHV